MNIVLTRLALLQELATHGFAQYGADPSDFGKEGHPVKFKLGTTGKEITLSVWKDANRVEVQRITQADQLGVLVLMVADYAQEVR